MIHSGSRVQGPVAGGTVNNVCLFFKAWLSFVSGVPVTTCICVRIEERCKSVAHPVHAGMGS